jgi:hypothetical protein
MKTIYRILREFIGMKRRLTSQPIRVGFVCHMPSIWGKLSPLYRLLRDSLGFETVLIACPYRHNSFGDDDYHDAGMFEFLRQEEQTEPIKGYDETTGRWIGLRHLELDYVFFQTPYQEQFPKEFSSQSVSSHTKICYVPYYGTLVYKGEVEDITHPDRFFKNVNMAFVGNAAECNYLASRFPHLSPGKGSFVTGSPMNDSLLGEPQGEDGSWNLPHSEFRKRILWTPRWTTKEGNCHFFEYKDFFLDMAEERNDVDFLFRPHPLMLQNLVTTGEMPLEQQKRMLRRYEGLSNASINRSGNYQKIFLTSDILVSDMSSIMAEYFLTGKPIIYTHRQSAFNEFGERLSEGFYWARDEEELCRVLAGLLAGNDPLREKRASLTRELFGLPEGGAAAAIARILKFRAH